MSYFTWTTTIVAEEFTLEELAKSLRDLVAPGREGMDWSFAELDLVDAIAEGAAAMADPDILVVNFDYQPVGNMPDTTCAHCGKARDIEWFSSAGSPVCNRCVKLSVIYYWAKRKAIFHNNTARAIAHGCHRCFNSFENLDAVESRSGVSL